MPNCRECQAQIRFAKTEHGKAMPVDNTPSQDGNLVLYRQGGVLCVRSARLPADQQRPRHKSHFATCPKADAFRRRRK